MSNDIYSSLSAFLSAEAGIVYLAILGFMEFVLKPSLHALINGHRNLPVTKKVVLPLIVCMLTIVGAYFVRPDNIDTIGEIVIYGFGLGVVANFMYRIGLSAILKKIGLEEKVSASIFPPPNKDDE